MLTKALFAFLGLLLLAPAVDAATTIYPVHRAAIVAGSRFDFKVEFDRILKPEEAKITINGMDYAQALGRPAEFVEKEKGVDKSALILRDVVIDQPGYYQVRALDGKENTQLVTWEVYGNDGAHKAKNVILFLGDGFSVAHRTAARILSKGIS